MNQLFRIVLILVLLSFICQPSWSQQASTIGEQQPSLVFGSNPYGIPEEMQLQFAPLMEYLSQQLKRPVVLRIANDYKEMIKRIQAKAIDFGYLDAMAYVRAKRAIPDLRYLASPKARDASGEIKEYYHGIIVVKKTSGIQTMADLKGKKFGFTDTLSTSGYLYPKAMMKKQGIDPEAFFSNVFFLKKHPKVTSALAMGTIDGAATWDGNLIDAISEHGDIFRVIAKTDPIPLGALIVAPHLTDQEFENIRQAFLTLKPDSPVVLAGEKAGLYHAGYAFNSDAFYDIVREISNKGSD